MSRENLFVLPGPTLEDIRNANLSSYLTTTTVSSMLRRAAGDSSDGSSATSDILQTGSNQTLDDVLASAADLINSSLDSSSIDESLASFIHAIDICLAFFSGLNFVVNVWLLILCSSFVRNGCSSSSSAESGSERRPHYGLHLFIFNCAISSVLLEGIGSLTNIGYLFAGQNVFIVGVESQYHQHIIRKTLDFLTYGLFNVTHLNFVLLLNVDKLLYICRPLHYHELMSRRRVSMICVGTWMMALAMASPSLTIVDINAQLRQEAILFAMCVVCPASFDLISAIVVATIVFRIQLSDSSTRRSVMGPSRKKNKELLHKYQIAGAALADQPITSLIPPATFDEMNNKEISITIPNGTTTMTSCGNNNETKSTNLVLLPTVNDHRVATKGAKRSAPLCRTRTIRGDGGSGGGRWRWRPTENALRHFNVFLRTFTPIIWTLITTLPYTSTMIYLYFGSDGDDEFIRRWTDDTTFKVLRAFGCLYITYFTGVPFIIVFNYHPYRRKIKVATNHMLKRIHSIHRRFSTNSYESVGKMAHSGHTNGHAGGGANGHIGSWNSSTDDRIPQTMSSML